MSPSVEPFDEAKYKALMDGLECSEILFSTCKNILDFRIDASTYKKEYLSAEYRLMQLGAGRIGDAISSIQNFGAYSLCNYINFTTDGIPFLMTQNVKKNYIDWQNIRYIDKRSHDMLYKSHCRRGQVLITMAGAYLGKASVYNKDFACSSNQAIAKLSLKREISPYYVATYINSRYGQSQINRFKTITGQPNINMALIKHLLIPAFSDSLYDSINEISETVFSCFEKADSLFSAAQKKLINYTGIKCNSLSNSGVSTKNYSESFCTTGRLDAEYYQPKYDDLFTLLDHLSTKQLGDIVTMSKSIEPGSEYYGSEGVPFIRVSDVSVTGIEPPTIRIPQNIVPSIETLYPKRDTILFSKDGSVGIAYKVEEDLEAVTSGALLHLHVKNTADILPDYLTLVLNSEIVRLQAERDASGAIIQHWKPSDVAAVTIPILPHEMQIEIAQKVQESFALRRQAEALIEKAVRAVEIAIEEDESAAVAWLKS